VIGGNYERGELVEGDPGVGGMNEKGEGGNQWRGGDVIGGNYDRGEGGNQ
jgi:hypothetical protein